MNEHQRCIELAAAAIDFQLSPEEQHVLRTHLSLCSTCSTTVRGLRDDAAQLTAVPHPAAPVAVRQTVIGATRGRSRRTSSIRWAVLATMLAAVLVAGSFAVGSVVDRLRRQDLPVPTQPATVRRSTPAPVPTDQQAPRPTVSPRLGSGWNDLGDVSDAFGARTVMSVMTRPDGGLVAFGQDRVSTQPVVWVSDDGIDWTEVDQPAETFPDTIPTSGALGGPGMLVIGSAVSTQAAQRAIWESRDGRTWAESADPSARLATNADDLTMTSGPAGIIVWRPSGTAWVSRDGQTWTKGDIGRQGVSDVSVDAGGFAAVGQSGSNAFLVTSTDGLAWGTPRQQPASAGTQVGIERSTDGPEAVWIGDQRWQRTGSGWRVVTDATMPKVPDAGSVTGGQAELAAIGSVTASDSYRAWTWDGTGDWLSDQQAAEDGSGVPSIVSVTPKGTGWYVLTRRGTKLHGWMLVP